MGRVAYLGILFTDFCCQRHIQTGPIPSYLYHAHCRRWSGQRTAERPPGAGAPRAPLAVDTEHTLTHPTPWCRSDIARPPAQDLAVRLARSQHNRSADWSTVHFLRESIFSLARRTSFTRARSASSSVFPGSISPGRRAAGPPSFLRKFTSRPGRALPLPS